MKSIVLGASGFLGMACVDELLRRGDDVVGFDHRLSPQVVAHGPSATGSLKFVQGDIMDKVSLMSVFQGADEIYLLAGKLGTSELDHSLRVAIECNILGALQVFESALACGVPRVFFASKPSAWLNAYTITKHAAEKIAHLITQYHPIQISVLSYFNLFGPRQKLYPVRKIIPIFAAQAIKGLPLQVYGDGLQTVDMLFARDAARITVEVMRSDFNQHTMDCGSGTEMTVLAVAESVNRYFGNAAGVKLVPMRKGETAHTRLVADTSELVRTIGDLRLTPYDRALAESLDYYKDLSEHNLDAALHFFGISQAPNIAWT